MLQKGPDERFDYVPPCRPIHRGGGYGAGALVVVDRALTEETVMTPPGVLPRRARYAHETPHPAARPPTTSSMETPRSAGGLMLVEEEANLMNGLGLMVRNLKNTDIGILARLTSRVDPTRPTTRSLEL